MAATTGDAASILDAISSKAPSGMVLPPRHVREIIEKTAGYTARRGQEFEDRIKERDKDGNSKLPFIFVEDAYHPYYRWRIEEISAGRGTDPTAGKNTGEVSFQGREERKGPQKPEDFAFSARMPHISAQDLDVVKLTALYVAKNGRSWMTQLSQKEASNYQFDFLRSQHSLYQFFSRLVDQYSELLNGGTADGGKIRQKRIEELEANVKDRYRVLDKAKKRAEWVKHEEAKKVAEEEEEEKERVERAKIDWHDFVVVETVIFDESDESANLPAPLSMNDVQSASLEQKAAMSIDPGRRLEEAMPGEDFGINYAQPAPVPDMAPAVQMPPPQLNGPSWGQPTPPGYPQNAVQPPQADEDAHRLTTLQADRERARAAQEAAKANPPVKIRKDYVPAAQARKQALNTSICPNCKQAIPNDEMQRHLQIEMLDPQWREQSRKAQQRSLTTNLNHQEVANNLKRLASQRTDLFDPVTGQAISPEEQDRRKRAELQAYDGISTMPNPHAIAGMSTVAPGGPPGQEQRSNVDVQEQIRQLHQKYKT